MNFVSLFAGIGGFDLGFMRAGMTCSCSVEIDDKCGKVLRRHFPEVRREKDVRDFTTKGVDLICGGFPCQGVSVAGRGNGLADERSGLWFEFERVVGESEPKWVVIENVPGLLSSKGGRDFAVVLQGLERIGYGVAWRILDSQYFGVAQKRRRVFIIGSLGTYDCAEVLFKSESVPRDTAPGGKEGGETAGTSGECSGAEGNGIENPSGILDGRNPVSGNRVVRTLQAKSSGGYSLNYLPMYWDGTQVTDTLDASNASKQQAMPEKRRFQAVLSGGIRRLTPTECERLQGFPDGWTEGFSDGARYRMLGNAVTVNVAEWIGNRIMRKEMA